MAFIKRKNGVMMTRQFKVGDIVNAKDGWHNEALNAPIKRIFSNAWGFMTYDVGGMPFCEDELTLIRAVDEPAKTYKG